MKKLKIPKVLACNARQISTRPLHGCNCKRIIGVKVVVCVYNQKLMTGFSGLGDTNVTDVSTFCSRRLVWGN